MSFATNGTVSSSTTITTVATVHDDRMEVDVVDGFELVKGEGESLESGNATGALDAPRVDARGTRTFSITMDLWLMLYLDRSTSQGHR